LKDEYELEKGEDAPMSMATHSDSKTIICGVNSILEKMEKGENDNCRTFTVAKDKIKLMGTKSTLSGRDIDDYQKVTVISPDGTMLAVSGSHDLTLLSLPSQKPLCEPIHTDKEIYDVSFSENSLVIATTHNLLVYGLPGSASTSATQVPPSPKKARKKSKSSANGHSLSVQPLELQITVDVPSSTGPGSTFRSARFHPLDSMILYTAINTVAPRSAKAKGTSRQAFICKWNTGTWTIEKSRKVGDRGLTCFDISVDGRFLGFGSSDLTIGMLDAKTLSPLVTILKAHEFPPTLVKFNPSTSLLVSGSADNSIRIVSIPTIVAGATPGFIFSLILAFLAILLAIAAKYYGLM